MCVDKIKVLLYFYREIPIAIMTIGTDMFTVVNPDRMTTSRGAREFAKNQVNWSELKKIIYISIMVYLAGMGYSNSCKLFPREFNNFNSFMTSFFRFYSLNKTDYIHGGMDYNKAHELIINYPEFQDIDS